MSHRRFGTERNVRTIFSLMSDLGDDIFSFLDDQLQSAKLRPEEYKFPEDFSTNGYGKLYEFPVQHIATYLFQEAGIWQEFVAAAHEADPKAAILELSGTADSQVTINDTNAVPILAALCVLAVNLHAISTFHFSMPELLGQAARSITQPAAHDHTLPLG